MIPPQSDPLHLHVDRLPVCEKGHELICLFCAMEKPQSVPAVARASASPRAEVAPDLSCSVGGLDAVLARVPAQMPSASEPPVDTYTPMLWAVMTADEQYAEYVRVRRIAARVPAHQTGQQHEQEEVSRVDGVPEGAHGDLPRPATR